MQHPVRLKDLWQAIHPFVGGELAKSILSGGAAITSGTQDPINANF